MIILGFPQACLKKGLIIAINKDNLKYYQFLLGGFKVYGLKLLFKKTFNSDKSFYFKF